ncbi:hypothetical protein NFHSH190041_29040 [Shewanella sp. NFH-SH190041]|uniref:hypothetical protein n=1 Tax=Shewanella sp. NFH-SH190041 TaxID=2950245 RepID=UPI0021C2B40D|nr:hypothetical protein [Shewanella sp. NFH-SH190041]BDM65452.1 hypothetical protein NFHSH190041_29040 [Shewanella sp. NFH-SH190041]
MAAEADQDESVLSLNYYPLMDGEAIQTCGQRGNVNVSSLKALLGTDEFNKIRSDIAEIDDPDYINIIMADHTCILGVNVAENEVNQSYLIYIKSASKQYFIPMKSADAEMLELSNPEVINGQLVSKFHDGANYYQEQYSYDNKKQRLFLFKQLRIIDRDYQLLTIFDGNKEMIKQTIIPAHFNIDDIKCIPQGDNTKLNIVLNNHSQHRDHSTDSLNVMAEVIVNKAYFYQQQTNGFQLRKAYLIKGDKVRLLDFAETDHGERYIYVEFNPKRPFRG